MWEGDRNPSQLAASDTLVLQHSTQSLDPGDLKCRAFFFLIEKGKKSKKGHFACKWATARRAH